MPTTVQGTRFEETNGKQKKHVGFFWGGFGMVLEDGWFPNVSFVFFQKGLTFTTLFLFSRFMVRPSWRHHVVFAFHFFQLGPVGITFPECDVLLKKSLSTNTSFCQFLGDTVIYLCFVLEDELVGGRKQKVGYVEVKDLRYTTIQLHFEENILKKHCKNMVYIYICIQYIQ